MSFPRDKLVKEARLPLVEPLGVEGVREAKKPVVEVVAKLVEERPEERAEPNHPPLASRAHPEGDFRGQAAGPLRIEAMEFSPPRMRPGREDLDPHGIDSERPGQPIQKPLADRPNELPILPRQRVRERGDEGMQRVGLGEQDLSDAIAPVVDRFLTLREPGVIGEGHP